jgi:hypothetical protein
MSTDRQGGERHHHHQYSTLANKDALRNEEFLHFTHKRCPRIGEKESHSSTFPFYQKKIAKIQRKAHKKTGKAKNGCMEKFSNN